MSDKNEGLNDRLARKKRVQRMKTGLVWFFITWLLAQTLISITLIAKVHSLQEQIDIITENTIRSQQVEQKENQTLSSKDALESATGKESNNGESADQIRLSAKNAGQVMAGADQIKKAEKQRMHSDCMPPLCNFPIQLHRLFIFSACQKESCLYMILIQNI